MRGLHETLSLSLHSLPAMCRPWGYAFQELRRAHYQWRGRRYPHRHLCTSPGKDPMYVSCL